MIDSSAELLELADHRFDPLRAQAQLRRAMDYLRFEQQDTASLVPSLYMSPRKGRAEAEAHGPITR